MKGLLRRYWLIIAIACSVFAAVLLPGGASIFLEYRLVDLGVVVVMFLGALKLAPRRFKEAARSARLIGLSLASVFVAAPLAAMGLAAAFGLDSEPERVSVLICAAQASTLATAIVLTEVAGGDVALAILITVTNNVATAFLTPLAFHVLTGASIQVSYDHMALELTLKIVAPVLAGQIARRWLGRWAVRRRTELSITSQLIVLTYIYTGVAATLGQLEDSCGTLLKVLAFVAALHATLLTINVLLARLARTTADRRVAFILCSSQKTLPAAILVWKSHFASVAAGPLVAVCYHMLQLVVDSLVAPGLKKLPLVRADRAEAAERDKGDGDV